MSIVLIRENFKLFKDVHSNKNKMSFFHFPSNFVYWEDVTEHKKIKDMYLPKIREMEKYTKDNISYGGLTSVVNSSYSPTNSNTKYNEILLDNFIVSNVVWKTIDNMIEKINNNEDMFHIPVKDSIIGGCWYNSYDENNFHELHNHDSMSFERNGKMYHASFSIIYIINNESDKNDTIFKLRGDVPFSPKGMECRFDTSNEKSIKEGTVMVFSALLDHVVKPVKIPGRTTIVYNLFSSYS